MQNKDSARDRASVAIATAYSQGRTFRRACWRRARPGSPCMRAVYPWPHRMP